MNFSDPEIPDANPQNPGSSDAARETEGSEPQFLQPPQAPPAFLPPEPPVDFRVPEDIRTPWGLGEIFLFFGVAIVSLILLQVALGVFVLVHYHMTRAQLQDFLTKNAAVAVSFETVWSCVLLLFIFLMIRAYHNARFWDGLRWRKLRSRKASSSSIYIACVVGGVVLAVLVGVASRFAGAKSNLPIQQLFQNRTDILWLMVYGIAFAPFFEETVFRGYLYPAFARKWGILAGVIITGVLFGGVHAAQLWGGWAQIGLLVIVGIILTYARAQTGSVLASYLIHLSYNTFLFTAFVVGTHGLKHIPHLH